MFSMAGVNMDKGQKNYSISLRKEGHHASQQEVSK